MGRVIKPETAGKERARLIKGIYLALRLLMNKQEVDNETRDLTAYIIYSLKTIWDGIDESVTPWEKRGYWVKADRFRMEWIWTQTLGMALQKAVLEENWLQVANLSGQVATHLGKVSISENHRLGTPWVGAWQRFIAKHPWGS